MAPKSKKQFEEMRQQSIAAIKQAALELFAHRGYASTSISQIAREAGISKGLMYNYFSSKEDLLRAIILDAVETGEKLVEGSLHESPEPHTQIQGIVESVFRAVKENGHYWKLLTSLAFQPGAFEGLEEIMNLKREANLAMGKALFSRLGADEPELEAYLFGAALDGMMMHYFFLEDEYPFDAMQAHIIKRFTPRPDQQRPPKERSS